MIQDTRRAPRRQPTDLVPVTDMLSEAQIGRLGNVSETGMLLLASVPLHDDALYQLRFALPERAGRAPKSMSACTCCGPRRPTHQARPGLASVS